MSDNFTDYMVLYHSVDDVEPNLWVAHSVRTDQVGVGHDPIEAVRELVFAVRTLLDEASRNPEVRVEQPAPIEVLDRLASATRLPAPLWDRIRKAIRSCQHHDAEYWSSSDGDDVWDETGRTYFGRIEQEDVCVA